MKIDTAISKGSQINKRTIITWNSPEDKMPDAELSVLVCVEGGLVEQGFWDGEDWEWACGATVENPVLFWADLPEGPK